MIDLLPISFDNIDALAASAFAQSRLCVVALREDIIPHLAPHERRGPERLIAQIERQRIFDDSVMNELDVLIETLTRRIADGTKRTEQFVADECHIEGGGFLMHTERNETAEAFVRAVPFLLVFQETLLGVHDLMQAERALDKLRQRI